MTWVTSSSHAVSHPLAPSADLPPRRRDRGAPPTADTAGGHPLSAHGTGSRRAAERAAGLGGVRRTVGRAPAAGAGRAVRGAAGTAVAGHGGRPAVADGP